MTTRFTAGNNTAEQRCCTAQLKPETKPSKQKPMPRRRPPYRVHYRVGCPICRKVLQIMFWKLPPADWLKL